MKFYKCKIYLLRYFFFDFFFTNPIQNALNKTQRHNKHVFNGCRIIGSFCNIFLVVLYTKSTLITQYKEEFVEFTAAYDGIFMTRPNCFHRM